MPLRGCVANTAITFAKAMSPDGPAAIFHAAANGLFPILYSLWEPNTAASVRILTVAMGYVNSKLRMEPKQALKYQSSSGKLKEVSSTFPGSRQRHGEDRRGCLSKLDGCCLEPQFVNSC